ncbi:TAXI family TRAP transporter solute-binding subunit [Haloferax mediterranei ATCC 33500]|uniref:C4-dicarboxylate ABC transporter substrate-binding protein n=1 Tax=Haloferax mediterranei (strain ATCC 33500 / DSM 1411 / JCM 8866 / NBRC 14739 / NCIMB 2177 / R-4) TaxID=523841 RepID=I3R8S8_HALMT|nr:TAXI family TRAP transporter solute-binding subunit [Haloferax mediterranei]AFK20638.1 immunogenic protein [Haloferax mediterranei ATCC 33500]AHZ22877.1 C4-dicarboxylate ABC transporter substrate-binding protein [Haloferax mediterranei ATCC 33500]EMA03042.1 immunogenic protein [Haloferax mediterranei ATCC 33500]MDX5987777.1 TAXI family TRAP transporter solute-binding subunit [Haloferax mediterranei ATCC 33500]QCQ74256.1 TAXI family TRAP transporter solute-binding subunit [Haloferax mediterr
MTRNLDRRQFIAATGAVGLAGLAGCTGGDGEGEETTTEAGEGEGTTTTTDGGNGETRLSWHAGGTGGTYFPLSNEFKSVIEGQTDFTIQVQSTGASVENVGSLARGDADFALIQNDVAYFARNGEGIEAFQGSPVENLRGVATLYPETIHIVTLADTGVEKPADLEGKTINTGDLGSGTQVNAVQILEALGISDYEQQNTGFSQASDQLKNGDIDAAFVVGGWPVGAIEELAATEDVRIVPIEGDARQSVKDAAPFYADDEVPSGTYGLENPAPTVSVQAMIATNAEQSEATVEAVTEAIFANVDQLTIKTDFISKESAQDGMSIELHPGAKAYFG